MRKGVFLLPVILFIMLGALVLILSTKLEGNRQTLESLNQRLLWLELHMISIKESIKIQLKQGILMPTDFTQLTFNLGDYHYTAVIKAFAPTIPNSINPSTQLTYYFIDILGIYRDSSKEVLQEFSTRRSFILSF